MLIQMIVVIFVMAMCALVTVYRDRLTADSTVLVCLLMLSGIPYFLPKMHERYTFGADGKMIR